ncbi:MAG: hypothetical protein RBT72_02475 [Spirochaetia bacterium]|jgi:hypothetical protein|nr:hypothetical protein [Spirochaetia bacterium]
MKTSGSKWTFARIGGVDQVVIKKGEDIANLTDLDQKLWAALAMPTVQPGIKESLEYLDADKDGRIRAPDILRCVEEFKATLKSLDCLLDGSDSLSATQVSDEGIKAAIAEVLSINTGAAGDSTIDLAAVEKAIAAFAALPFNGDGVVVPVSAKDEKLKAFLEYLVAQGYKADDASGNPGVSTPALDRFLADLEAYKAWSGDLPAFKDAFSDPAKGEKASALFKQIKEPVSDYFRRCRVLAMSKSPTAVAALEASMASVLAKNLPADSQELAQLPLALPNSEGLLFPEAAMHPNHAAAVAGFLELMGADLSKGVSRERWEEYAARIEAYGAWLGKKPAPEVCALGEAVLAGSADLGQVDATRALIEKDLAKAADAEALKNLKTLLFVKRDFIVILRNFVNFDNFYLRKKGLFQSGRLFLDARELEFCMDVKNPGAHGTMAGLASMYLIYCDLSQANGKKKSIVAGLTAGDADNIFVGRNGIFYDTEGESWNAVITKVVTQPISIREAFFSPYKWLVKTLEDMAMKRAASAEAASMSKMKATGETAAQAGKADAKPEQAVPKKMDVGTVAAIGVALGSIGAMVTGILTLFVGMGVWIPVGIVGILLLISGPSMILAYLKLRKRNIGPLLNAEGWAVNSRLKINVPFGGSLSHLAVLPPGANRQLADPFAEKKKPWGLYLAIVLVVGALVAAYFLGWLGFIPGLGR